MTPASSTEMSSTRVLWRWRFGGVRGGVCYFDHFGRCGRVEGGVQHSGSIVHISLAGAMADCTSTIVVQENQRLWPAGGVAPDVVVVIVAVKEVSDGAPASVRGRRTHVALSAFARPAPLMDLARDAHYGVD